MHKTMYAERQITVEWQGWGSGSLSITDATRQLTRSLDRD